MDDASAAIVQEIVRRESRSFLQYVAESFPWITDDDREVLARVRALIDEQSCGIAELARFLTRNNVALPYFGSFPASFTSWNFVSLRGLLPRLADDVRQAVAALRQGIEGITDPQAKQVVERFLQTKSNHLKTLEALTSQTPQPIA